MEEALSSSRKWRYIEELDNTAKDPDIDPGAEDKLGGEEERTRWTTSEHTAAGGEGCAAQ